MTRKRLEPVLHGSLTPLQKFLRKLSLNRYASAETLCGRFVRYAEESYRDGIIGAERHSMLLSHAEKLRKFLTIKGIPDIPPECFSTEILLEYRRFLLDEYLYVPRYPDLYPPRHGKGFGHPEHPASANTVVTHMKGLQAFLGELEKTDEIVKSPFRRLTSSKKRALMHTMYNEPIFLRKEEFDRLVAWEAPPTLRGVKAAFLLNCCLGCRFGDFGSLSEDNLSVSQDGIPYIHYIPSKTSRTRETNSEIVTPLVKLAYEIILKTRFNFGFRLSKGNANAYNAKIRTMLRLAGICRCVTIYDRERKANVYVPLYMAASSKLARKTHIDLLTKVQVDIYAAGLHSPGSGAVSRYTTFELKDRFTLLSLAFGQPDYRAQ